MERFYSQDVVVNGNIDRDSILTGHTFNYNLSIRIPNGYIINWSEIKDTLSKSIEVIGRSEINLCINVFFRVSQTRFPFYLKAVWV